MKSLTIITVVFNEAIALRSTIESLRIITFKDFQYIVIDGGSTDGTLEVIEANSDLIDLYISEPDHGIYDAMNKGLGFSEGYFVHYLNAGDLVLKDAYKDIFSSNEPLENYDVIYGDLVVSGTDVKYVSRPLNTIFREMPIFHPAVFIKLNVLREFQFNINYKIAGDYDLILRLYLAKKSFLYIPICVTAFNLGGVSNTNFKLAILETSKSIFINSPRSNKWGNLLTYFKGKIEFIAFNLLVHTLGRDNYQKFKSFLNNA